MGSNPTAALQYRTLASPLVIVNIVRLAAAVRYWSHYRIPSELRWSNMEKYCTVANYEDLKSSNSNAGDRLVWFSKIELAAKQSTMCYVFFNCPCFLWASTDSQPPRVSKRNFFKHHLAWFLPNNLPLPDLSVVDSKGWQLLSVTAFVLAGLEV